MNRLHCALNTNHFHASIAFYTKLLGQTPAKAVVEAKERLEELGLITRLEEDVDYYFILFRIKVWVTDPNGHNWQPEECCD